MLERYEAIAKTSHDNQRAELELLTAALRSILQVSVISALDVYVTSLRNIDDRVDLNGHILSFLSPADGVPVTILDDLVPAIRSVGWTDFCRGWYEDHELPDGAKAMPLVKALQRWVTFRNNRQGHGVLDDKTIANNIGWIRNTYVDALTVLAGLIPATKTVLGGVHHEIKTPFGSYRVRSMPPEPGPFVVRQVREKRGVWVLTYQTLNLESSSEKSWELPTGSPLVSFDSQYDGGYRKVIVNGEEMTWQVETNVPPRQTSIFEPRTQECQELREWFDDSESKACLVYGDGGIGKTTLLLEFLNDVLEGDLQISYKPEIISYYSAKLTRWTANGVMHYSGIQPNLSEAVRQLVAYYEGNLGKDWYKIDGVPLIDRAAALYGELGIEKNKIVLVVDNTETLAHNPDDQKELGKLFAHIARRLARVIITSRRREKLEARPVEVLPLEEDRGADLLEKLAMEYDIAALKQAGRKTLKGLSRRYSGKPLLIEAHARYMKQLNLSVADAEQRILQESKEGLCEFLYEDAWKRIAPTQQVVFIVLAKCSLPLTSDVVGWVCKEAEIATSQWLEAFNETYFGKQRQYGLDFEIELDPFAREFFLAQYGNLVGQRRTEIDALVSKVTAHFRERASAQSAYVSDRITEAFRTPEAKAAKIATRRGDYGNAHAWFLEAIEVDSDNPYLFDRFAWYLMKFESDLPLAETMARKACELSKEKIGETLFTLGLILYRQGKIEEGDKNMLAANANGKPEDICLIQMAEGRLGKVRRLPKSFGKKEQMDRIALLKEARKYATNALAKVDDRSIYGNKNRQKCEHLGDTIDSLLTTIRLSKTKD